MRHCHHDRGERGNPFHAFREAMFAMRHGGPFGGPTGGGPRGRAASAAGCSRAANCASFF